MGWYLRKSFSFGPFRLNLSKSGLDASFGVKGARVGTGLRGTYVHVGRGGVYYRESLSSKPRASAHRSAQNVASSSQIVSDEEVKSGDFVTGINARIGRQSSAPSTWGRTILLSLALLLSPCIAGCALSLFGIQGDSAMTAILATFIVGVGATALLLMRTHRSERRRVAQELKLRSANLQYELDAEQSGVFTSVQQACYQLSRAAAVWHVQSESPQWDGRKNAGATALIHRRRIAFSRIALPFIHVDLDIWGADLGTIKVGFLPDRILVFQNGRYAPLPYKEISVSVVDENFLDEDGVPSDAQVLGYAWKYQRVDGGPDLRFAGNFQVPMVRYARVSLGAPGGFDLRMQVSNRSAAKEFARWIEHARAAYRGDESKDSSGAADARDAPRWQDVDAAPDEARPPPPAPTDPYNVLGVTPDATMEVVTAAFRRLAKQYHPDAVSHLGPEFQELAHKRMLEINAAFNEARRRRS